MDKVIMGDNNPMMVEYFTYKVEFQDRGAGHIHGILWLKLERMERLIRTDNDQLFLNENGDVEDEGITLDKNENINKPNLPFKGIVSAFKKLKNNEDLSELEQRAELMNSQLSAQMKTRLEKTFLGWFEK
jgi:hypothetical protein